MRVKSDPQPQFSHAVLLQQLQVWTQGQAKCPGDALCKSALFGGVGHSSLGIVSSHQEEHLDSRGFYTCKIDFMIQIEHTHVVF